MTKYFVIKDINGSYYSYTDLYKHPVFTRDFFKAKKFTNELEAVQIKGYIKALGIKGYSVKQLRN